MGCRKAVLRVSLNSDLVMLPLGINCELEINLTSWHCKVRGCLCSRFLSRIAVFPRLKRRNLPVSMTPMGCLCGARDGLTWYKNTQPSKCFMHVFRDSCMYTLATHIDHNCTQKWRLTCQKGHPFCHGLETWLQRVRGAVVDNITEPGLEQLLLPRHLDVSNGAHRFEVTHQNLTVITYRFLTACLIDCFGSEFKAASDLGPCHMLNVSKWWDST
jgi:hypothetical protein